MLLAAVSRQMHPKNGHEAVGGQRPRKEALMTLPIVDKLTADAAIHLSPSFAQIMDGDVRTVLAVAVGKHAVLKSRAAQIESGISRCRNGANRCDRDRLTRTVANEYLDVRERPVGIGAQAIHKIRLTRQSRKCDRPLL